MFQVRKTSIFLPHGLQIFVEFWLNQNSLVADIPTFAHGAMVSCIFFLFGLTVKVVLNDLTSKRPPDERPSIVKQPAFLRPLFHDSAVPYFTHRNLCEAEPLCVWVSVEVG